MAGISAGRDSEDEEDADFQASESEGDSSESEGKDGDNGAEVVDEEVGAQGDGGGGAGAGGCPLLLRRGCGGGSWCMVLLTSTACFPGPHCPYQTPAPSTGYALWQDVKVPKKQRTSGGKAKKAAAAEGARPVAQPSQPAPAPAALLASPRARPALAPPLASPCPAGGRGQEGAQA